MGRVEDCGKGPAEQVPYQAELQGCVRGLSGWAGPGEEVKEENSKAGSPSLRSC